METVTTQHNTHKEIDGTFFHVETPERLCHVLNRARHNHTRIDDNQYMIIENTDTFEEASKRDFTPILYFRTQNDLVEQLYKSINH